MVPSLDHRLSDRGRLRRRRPRGPGHLPRRHLLLPVVGPARGPSARPSRRISLVGSGLPQLGADYAAGGRRYGSGRHHRRRPLHAGRQRGHGHVGLGMVLVCFRRFGDGDGHRADSAGSRHRDRAYDPAHPGFARAFRTPRWATTSSPSSATPTPCRSWAISIRRCRPVQRPDNARPSRSSARPRAHIRRDRRSASSGPPATSWRAARSASATTPTPPSTRTNTGSKSTAWRPPTAAARTPGIPPASRPARIIWPATCTTAARRSPSRTSPRRSRSPPRQRRPRRPSPSAVRPPARYQAGQTRSTSSGPPATSWPAARSASATTPTPPSTSNEHWIEIDGVAAANGSGFVRLEHGERAGRARTTSPATCTTAARRSPSRTSPRRSRSPSRRRSADGGRRPSP